MLGGFLYGEIRCIGRFPFQRNFAISEVFLYGEVIYLERFLILEDFVIPEVYYTATFFSSYWEVP